MEIIRTIDALNQRIDTLKRQGRIVGFVPTMGALHKGHISLVNRAGVECSAVIVSIFVNPTQFNNPDDLERYPRDLQKDVEKLRPTLCKIVFAPSIEEMYPQPDTRRFDFGMLDKVMEGAFRPGHFNGVAQVVSRLFDIVKPDKAFFGEKDFQQLAVINKMVHQLGYDIEIVPCPIVREKDGLAKSSRNVLLSEVQRQNAPEIWHTLFESLTFANSNSVEQTRKFVIDGVNAIPELKVEYFDIVNGETLQSIDNWDDADYVAGCIAVFAGDIRLIDNVIYKNNIL
ncbi:MAG: pantoate--beta-alanine ligase [Cytophagaceae bacterium]|jgi:pantoate--beta-alanine ligase|nr:pantoate--beta-alanine ligase [Cytophagaceae bacterium]